MSPLSARSLTTIACGLVAGLAFAPRPATPDAPCGQDSGRQDPARNKAASFVMEAGTHDLVDLLARSARFLKRNHMIDAAAANFSDMQIRLDNPLALDARGCEEVMCQLAFTKGLAMVPIDTERGLYEWIAFQGPRRSELSTRALPLDKEEARKKRHLLGLPVMVSLTLQHIPGVQAVNGLRPFFAGGGPSQALNIGATNRAILLQGFAPSVASAIDLLEKIDVPQPQQVDPAQWRQSVERRLQALEKRSER